MNASATFRNDESYFSCTKFRTLTHVRVPRSVMRENYSQKLRYTGRSQKIIWKKLLRVRMCACACAYACVLRNARENDKTKDGSFYQTYASRRCRFFRRLIYLYANCHILHRPVASSSLFFMFPAALEVRQGMHTLRYIIPFYDRK